MDSPLLAALRATAGSAPGGDAVREAAEDVVRGDWWGHYCPSCGSTFKHGPECRIGRLAKALSSARSAAPATPTDTLANGFACLREFARCCRDNFDHDESAHEHGTFCRACEAEAALAIARNEPPSRPLPPEVEAAAEALHPYADWHEDDGPVLWYAVPVEEPPYCGEPLCSDWPNEWNAPYDTVTGAFIDGPYTGKVLKWQRLPALPPDAALSSARGAKGGGE